MATSSGYWSETAAGTVNKPKTEAVDVFYSWSSGTIDPGQSLGFGKPSFLLGLSTSRLLTDRQTVHVDLSYIHF